VQVALEEYQEALERLRKGIPNVVPRGTKINNDSVSVEAGRKKGSIKKSRPQFAKLIADIETAAEAQTRTPQQELLAKLAKHKEEAKRYRELYEAALAREQSLVAEVFTLKLKLAELTGQNVIPIHQARSVGEMAS
jgi:septum formation topological specificity factor MinE